MLYNLWIALATLVFARFAFSAQIQVTVGGPNGLVYSPSTVVRVFILHHGSPEPEVILECATRGRRYIHLHAEEPHCYAIYF